MKSRYNKMKQQPPPKKAQNRKTNPKWYSYHLPYFSCPHYNHRLCQDVCEAGCIPSLCQLLSQSPSLHPSCLRILRTMATGTEGVAEVRKHLPINSLCKLLDSDPEVQVCLTLCYRHSRA